MGLDDRNTAPKVTFFLSFFSFQVRITQGEDASRNRTIVQTSV